MAMNIHGMSDHIYFVLNWIICADIQKMFEHMANAEKVEESDLLSKFHIWNQHFLSTNIVQFQIQTD